MSIKDDVEYVKKELSSDEKVLESAFKLETFYKKYKVVILGIVGAVLLFVIATSVMDAVHASKLEAANQALLKLEKNPEDQAAMKALEENNPKLFELYRFSQAAKKQDTQTLTDLSSGQNDILADMSRYTKGAIVKVPVDSKLYKELSYFEEAYIAIKQGDVAKAKEKLTLIDERSPIAALARLLEHSTLKAK